MDRFSRRNRIPGAPTGRCRGCGQPVTGRRRTWCSEACVTDALVRSGDPGVIRRELEQRDRGVCQACGRDCGVIDRVRRRLDARGRRLGATRDERDSYARAIRWLFEVSTGQPVMMYGYGHLWEADHITPVVEGGGACGLDNYRTLCRPCHVAETAKLAARRALSRRLAKQPELLPCRGEEIDAEDADIGR